MTDEAMQVEERHIATKSFSFDDWNRVIEVEDDDDSVREAEVKAELEAYERVVDSFARCYRSWSLENLPQMMRQLESSLRELDESTNKPVLQGYVGTRILGHVLGAMVPLLNNSLPEFHRVGADQVDDLVLEFATGINSRRFSRSTRYRTIDYRDLLDISTAERIFEPLTPDTAAWLSKEAELRLQQLLPYLCSEQASTELDAVQLAKLEADCGNLLSIAAGRFPPGFNTEHETRWEFINYEFLLQHDAGNVPQQDKVLAPSQGRSLFRYARELRTALLAKRDANPEEFAQNEILQRQLAWLEPIAEHSVLPHGYTVAPEEDKESV